MIPYSRLKRSDLYTLSKSKLENHTLHSGTYLYSPYMSVPSPGVYQGWGLPTARSGPTDPPKEKGRKFAPTAPIAFKFRLGNTR